MGTRSDAKSIAAQHSMKPFSIT